MATWDAVMVVEGNGSAAPLQPPGRSSPASTTRPRCACRLKHCFAYSKASLRLQPARWRGARATGRCSFDRTPDICKANPCEGGCRALTRLAAGNQCALHEGNPLRFPGVEL